MSKAKFAAAKELIEEKRFDEARGILRTIDHPTAREWEAKIDKLNPPEKPKRGEKIPAFPAVKAKRKKAPKVKVIRIGHGLLGNPNSSRIQSAIQKWMGKGYELKEQVDQRGRGLTNGYTLLTFVEIVE